MVTFEFIYQSEREREDNEMLPWRKLKHMAIKITKLTLARV